MPLLFKPALSEPRPKGAKAIIPSISVGNVGQLSVDVLLASLPKVTKLAEVFHSALLPVAMQDAIDPKSNKLMTACQLYYDSSHNTYLFQLRSSVAKGRSEEFLDDLFNWSKANEINQLIVLTGSAAEERIDEQLQGSQLRYVAAENAEKEVFAGLDWLELEKRDRLPGLKPGKEVKEDDHIFIPGAGFAKKLFIKGKESGLKTTVLLKFCSEGDNTRDALELVQYYNQWQKQIVAGSKGKIDLKVPISWQKLFGNAVPNAMY